MVMFEISESPAAGHLVFPLADQTKHFSGLRAINSLELPVAGFTLHLLLSWLSSCGVTSVMLRHPPAEKKTTTFKRTHARVHAQEHVHRILSNHVLHHSLFKKLNKTWTAVFPTLSFESLRFIHLFYFFVWLNSLASILSIWFQFQEFSRPLEYLPFCNLHCFAS